jgi:hypothetical protein
MFRPLERPEDSLQQESPQHGEAGLRSDMADAVTAAFARAIDKSRLTA